jgi:iron(III) transport system substrate-binding protein
MKRYLMSSIWGVAMVCLALSVDSPGFAQQDLIEGAKKEGEVVVWVHTMANPNKVIKPFEKKYPFLKVKFWDSRSATMIARMIEEAKAGRYSPDVVTFGARNWPELLEAGLLKEQEWPAHVNKWPYQPKHGYWRLHAASLRLPTYNSRRISTSDAPKSWEDLKDTKWRGKSVMSTSGGDSLLLFGYLWRNKGEKVNWEKAKAYWGEVIDNTKPRVVRGFSSPNELHAAGEFPLFLLNSTNVALRMIQVGAPIKIVPIKETVGSSWGVSIPKTVPHPNAAMLFRNYLLSQEGLLKYADANLSPIYDPEVAKKAKANRMLKELGITWYSAPQDIFTADLVRESVTWWGNKLGVRRGRKGKKKNR